MPLSHYSSSCGAMLQRQLYSNCLHGTHPLQCTGSTAILLEHTNCCHQIQHTTKGYPASWWNYMTIIKFKAGVWQKLKKHQPTTVFLVASPWMPLLHASFFAEQYHTAALCKLLPCNATTATCCQHHTYCFALLLD